MTDLRKEYLSKIYMALLRTAGYELSNEEADLNLVLSTKVFGQGFVRCGLVFEARGERVKLSQHEYRK